MTSMQENLPRRFAASLERFQAKWMPVGVRKTRKNKKPKHLAILVLTAFALGRVANAAVAEPAAATDENRLQSPDTDIAKKKGNLSDKLESTNGVIHPEGSVDPGIQQPTPPAGPMPVIPPPGAPGGNPRLQPK